ncbi:hypothetical protein GGR51DRAFT_568376 [Nemania sp. FL0031]|nr:hypothetical protein GGR51DRAFT_568376 [Nemania sp. FL0031]
MRDITAASPPCDGGANDFSPQSTVLHAFDMKLTRAKDLKTSNSYILQSYEGAHLHLKYGELIDARRAFKNALAPPNVESQPPDDKFDQIEIRMQIALVEMYLGSYKASEQNFLSIKQELDCMAAIASNELRDKLRFRCRRCLASCRLLMGQWEEAVTEMNSILNDNPDKSHIRLYRDLALAYASICRYSEARRCIELAEMKVEEKYGLEREPTNELQTELQTRLQTKKASIKVAMAIIDILAGDYQAALTSASNTMELVDARDVRYKAIKTLKAWCLVFNGKYFEAEELLPVTYKIMNNKFDRSRPQTLDTMSCLVYVYKCEGRVGSAILYGKGLDRLCTEWVTEEGVKYPQAIRSKFLLATAFLRNGQYTKSKQVIDEVVDQAKHVMGATHPETLRYKSEQARIIFCLGNVSKARDLALRVATQQLELYSFNPSTTNPKETNLSHLRDALNQSSTTPHPFLVSTLELIANIEARKHLLSSCEGGYLDLDIPREILTIIRQSYSKTSPWNEVLLSYINYSLAKIRRAGSASADEFPKATELFAKAYEDLKSCIGKKHLDTLCALRELGITECIGLFPRLDSETARMGTILAESLNTMQRLQRRLRPFHQETLRSQLCYLTIDMLLDGDANWNKMCQEITESLSNPKVVNERLVESLDMKWQLAFIFIGAGMPQEVAGLVDDAILEIDRRESGEEDDLLREPLSDLRVDFLELRQSIRDGGENEVTTGESEERSMTE